MQVRCSFVRTGVDGSDTNKVICGVICAWCEVCVVIWWVRVMIISVFRSRAKETVIASRHH